MLAPLTERAYSRPSPTSIRRSLMKQPVRSVGLVTTALFAAALAGCSGTAGTTTPGTGGSGTGGTTAHGGTGGSGGTGGGTGGTSAGGTGGTTGRGGTGGIQWRCRRSGWRGRHDGPRWQRRRLGSTGGHTGRADRAAAAHPDGGSGRRGGSVGGRRGWSERRRRRGWHRRRPAGRRDRHPVVHQRWARRHRDRHRLRWILPGACPNYKINAPDRSDTLGSSCNNGPGYMCARQMVFSPEFKQRRFDDWGMDDPPFVYGVVGHDLDAGGVDANGRNACCQCYQLIFESPTGASGLPTPKPMIVQAFNTARRRPQELRHLHGGGRLRREQRLQRQYEPDYSMYPAWRQLHRRRARAATASARTTTCHSSSIATKPARTTSRRSAQMIKSTLPPPTRAPARRRASSRTCRQPLPHQLERARDARRVSRPT